MRDLQRLSLHVGIPACNGELILYSPQFEIIACDFGGDTNEHVQPRGFRGRELGVGGLHGSPDAAEQIEFPRRIKTGVVKFKFAISARCTGQRSRFAEQTVLIAGVALNCRREVVSCEPPQSTSFLEVRCGDAQVVIVSDGAVNKAVEFCILETLPPCRERRRIRGDDVGRTVREGNGDRGWRCRESSERFLRPA